MTLPLESWRGLGVLVTGASSGIGRGLALRAAEEGAHLALLSRRAHALEQVASEARALGAEVEVVPCDVADRGATESAIAAAERALGGVDVAFVNAGVGRHRALIEHDLDDAARILQVNLLGALHCAHPLARAMVQRGRGWLAFTASIAGLVPVPGESVYSASKHGVVGLADALSIELEPHGVHVLTVCPGAVRTGFAAGEEHRMPAAAARTAVDVDDVVDATFDALARGAHRAIVPRSLGVAVAARGLVPSLVREGTARATRAILKKRV